MSLSQFIRENREPILAEWEEFARTCAPASGSMNIHALRDHANEMLTAIATDLDTPQDEAEQKEKSTGNAPVEPGVSATAAEAHGAGRAHSGFSVDQMVAEFRALRASVIRLWIRSQGDLTSRNIEDLTRFNEAIDQALAESVGRYTNDLDRSKDMFLGVLGHDLRSPLSAITMSSRFMLETGELGEPHLTLTARISSSADRMQHMIEDLLDLTRGRLGGGIPIVREDMSIDKAVHDAVDEICAAHPDRTIELDSRSGVRGQWDCARVSQVFANLIGNAVEHGDQSHAVSVTVRARDDEVTVAIHNFGAAIPPEKLNGIFSPMKAKESAGDSASGPSGHLGLGLYIAERIVKAHEGTIDVDSSDAKGTTFTVHLPRSHEPAQGSE